MCSIKIKSHKIMRKCFLLISFMFSFYQCSMAQNSFEEKKDTHEFKNVTIHKVTLVYLYASGKVPLHGITGNILFTGGSSSITPLNTLNWYVKIVTNDASFYHLETNKFYPTLFLGGTNCKECSPEGHYELRNKPSK